MARITSSTHWNILLQVPKLEQEFSQKLSVNPLVARVLVARGCRTVAEAQKFLNPSLERDWYDPRIIPGLNEAADRVQKAIEDHQRIAVFGDFDVDGMSSTCLLTLALRDFGADVRPYIPHRFGEGYGLSIKALERMLADGAPNLVITVDNGIASAKEVQELVARGIDVVVTDHHEPAELVPQGVPVADPKLTSECPSRELSGVGVALKLVCELGRRLGKPEVWKSYLDIATLGTLSDMMLLNSENRALVSAGIRQIHSGKRPGLVALAAAANQDISEIHADELPFSIIPRLNAAGRMGSTELALDLLLSDDIQEATILAGKLEEINTNRRTIESQLTNEALLQAQETYDGSRAIVLAGEGWHEGVKGIVASRVVNRYHVPCILFTIEDGIARGSGRSVGSVDLFHAVEECSDLLIRFGGHQGAVGVTLKAEKIDEFRHRLSEALSQLPAKDFESTGEVSALVTLSEINAASLDALEALQPFGQGNKKPLFAVQGVTMRNRNRAGAGGIHLCFMASDGVSSVASIMFRAPHIDVAADYDGAVDIVFEAVNETWQGRTKPKLMVKDILYRDTPEDEEDLFEDLSQVLVAQGSSKETPSEVPETPSQPLVCKNTAIRAELASCESAALTERLRDMLIGNRQLLPAQKTALNLLEQGNSCLCVMATGRGKSLIFHIHALREALLAKRASVFIYPLRALVHDQAHHLEEEFSACGASAVVLTGETSQERRGEIFAALTDGSIDVVLTTPEFFTIHTQAFAASGRIGFVVIDEAHHAGQAVAEGRHAYADMPKSINQLGNPQVLAVTATASTATAQEICRLFNISEQDVIKDVTVRNNLRLKDMREAPDREAALTCLVASGEKCIVYVNSREQAQSVCRMLRHTVSEMGHKIVFYHAGLAHETRKRIESAFRNNEVTCVVATSAFGEGINIHDIRHVVLYHLPFGRVAYNQMSGRAGRDGARAYVHLLFGAHDMRINERILSSAAPKRAVLVPIYRALMTLFARAQKEGRLLRATNEEIAALALAIDPKNRSDERAVACALDIFAELGLLSLQGFDEKRNILMNIQASSMDLESSARYAEGLKTRSAFTSFAQWALSASADELLSAINKPIAPEFGIVVDGEEGVLYG